MPIAFSECRVQREFHHDNLLQWVLLVVLLDIKRERHFIFYNTTTPPSIYTLLSTVQSLYLSIEIL